MLHLEVESNVFLSNIIKESMFGINFVTSYDWEFSDNQKNLELLSQLNASSLRFPGGSVTERDFTEASFLTSNWAAEVYTDRNGNSNSLISLSDFISVAAHIGADIQLVVPTRVAFKESAGQALANGNYGSRQDLSSEYLQLVLDYLSFASAEAEQNGVQITRLELGNEFWGSGEMSAAEYGILAARLAVLLRSIYPNVEIVAQVASSANMYSPLNEQKVYLEPDGNGDYFVHIKSEYKGVIPSGWLEGAMPANGNAVTQTRTIADSFLAVDGAVTALSGIVDHVYFDAGFDGIDTQRDFALRTIPYQFATRLGTVDVDTYVTEWSARNPRASNSEENLGNANGLHYAHSTIEAFFELSSNGVDSANFWPTTFGNPSLLIEVLIDTKDGDLTFGGIAFLWLSRSTPGLTPFLDLEIEGVIDIHGFISNTNLVLFVGERSGLEQISPYNDAISITLKELGESLDKFVTVSYMTSDDGSFDNILANPVINNSGGVMITGNIIEMNLEAYGLAKIEVQFVTDGDDEIVGSERADEITGGGGNDYINGVEGDILSRVNSVMMYC